MLLHQFRSSRGDLHWLLSGGGWQAVEMIHCIHWIHKTDGEKFSTKATVSFKHRSTLTDLGL